MLFCCLEKEVQICGRVQQFSDAHSSSEKGLAQPLALLIEDSEKTSLHQARKGSVEHAPSIPLGWPLRARGGRLVGSVKVKAA